MRRSLPLPSPHSRFSLYASSLREESLPAIMKYLIGTVWLQMWVQQYIIATIFRDKLQCLEITIRLRVNSLPADKFAWATAAHVDPLRASPLSEKYTVTALASSFPGLAQNASEAPCVAKRKAYSSTEDTTNDPDAGMIADSVSVSNSPPINAIYTRAE